MHTEAQALSQAKVQNNLLLGYLDTDVFDRSFVMAALRSEEARAVIRSIITLGHSLGLVTTGEGVEDLNTFDYLSRTDCDLAQGYFLSRPIDGAEAMKWGHDHLESWR